MTIDNSHRDCDQVSLPDEEGYDTPMAPSAEYDGASTPPSDASRPLRWSADQALHVARHVDNCPPCDAYFAHITGVEHDAFFADAYAVTRESFFSAAEVLTLRQRVADETRAHEQAKAAVQEACHEADKAKAVATAFNSVVEQTVRALTDAWTRERDQLRKDADRYRAEVDELQELVDQVSEDADQYHDELQWLRTAYEKLVREREQWPPASADHDAQDHTRRPIHSLLARGPSSLADRLSDPSADASPAAHELAGSSKGRATPSPTEAGAGEEDPADVAADPATEALPRPCNKGGRNFQAVRDHWVDASVPGAVQRWQILTDGQIAGALSGDVRWETGQVNVVQRELCEGVRNVPRWSRSPLIRLAHQFTAVMASEGNHPMLGYGQVGTGVRLGANGVWNETDLFAARWMDALRHAHVALPKSVRSRVARLVRMMFQRPGFYASRLPEVTAGVLKSPAEDPTTKTFLSATTRFNASEFTAARDISEDHVVRWLYETIRVPRAAARLVLEPYFRRSARHRAALQAWDQLRADRSTPATLLDRMNRVTNVVRRFQPLDSRNYTVCRRAVFASQGSTRVFWHMPRVLPTDQDVDANLDWIGADVRPLFEQRYRALCRAAEAFNPPSSPADDEEIEME